LSAKIWNGRTVIDQLVTVAPRQIPIVFPEGGQMGECQRPIIGETMKGKRVSLGNSDTVPAGSVCEFTISYDEMKAKKAKKPKADKDGNIPEAEPSAHISTRDWIMELLAHTHARGLGQWRNSGKGACIVEVDED
jgi:hypothetical protein